MFVRFDVLQDPPRRIVFFASSSCVMTSSRCFARNTAPHDPRSFDADNQPPQMIITILPPPSHGHHQSRPSMMKSIINGGQFRHRSLVLLLLLLLFPATCTCLIQPSVLVCRNKDCCKQAPHLLETVSDLLGHGSSSSAITVESHGCLSHCEKGPNARVELPGKPLLFLHELKDATDVMVQLELVADGAIKIPKLIGAAARVLERVQATKDPVEQERLLGSVITKLAAADSGHSESTALAHAYSLRARALANQEKWSMAIEDAQKVVLGEKLRLAATDASLSLSYRVWADAEEQLRLIDEKDGETHNKERVIAVLQHWQKAQPNYRTKLQREMQEILDK